MAHTRERRDTHLNFSFHGSDASLYFLYLYKNIVSNLCSNDQKNNVPVLFYVPTLP